MNTRVHITENFLKELETYVYELHTESFPSKSYRLLCLTSGLLSEHLPDLLYYDAIITKPLLKTPWMESFYVKEDIDLKIRLAEAGLLFDTSAFLDSESYAALFNYSFASSLKSSYYSYEAAKRDMEIASLVVFESLTRLITSAGMEKGFHLSGRYLVDTFPESFPTAENSILTIVYSYLPTFEARKINIDSLIHFLLDRETIQKRKVLFLWQSDMESQLLSGKIRLNQINEMVAESLFMFSQHTKRFDKTSLVRKGEFVTNFQCADEIIIEVNNHRRLNQGVKPLTFGVRHTTLNQVEIASPIQDIAYIIYTNKKKEYI